MDAPAAQSLRLRTDDGIAWITLDHPPLNVLNIALLDELDEALRSLQTVSDLRLVVIEGAGRMFSAGVDVGEHRGASLRPMLERFASVAKRLVAHPVPTLAVVHGAALGGACELVALCDLALVADDAKIGVPEIALAVVPPAAAALFPGFIGRQRANALVLTGEPLSGAEAAASGLVWRSVPAERLREEAERVVALFRGRSAAALRLAKQTIRDAWGYTLIEALDDANELQLRAVPAMADADEGLRAFLEKRPPRWVHR